METSTVNLILEKEPEQYSLPQKFYFWTINIGRAIIVLTELVVLVVFAARFKLDRDLNDLSEKIEIKKSIAESYGDLEPRVRTLQNRLNVVKKVKNEQTAFSHGLSFLATSSPSDFTLTNLQLAPTTINLNAKATSPQDFAKFISVLTQADKVKDIALTGCNWSETEQKFQLALRISPKENFYQ
ncbi:MAG: hypothetical protein Q8N84_00610 [bacterium]|nr:hypothetical protein [bacterium]